MKHRWWVGLIVLLLVAVAAAFGQTQPSTSNTSGMPTTTAPPLPGGYGLVASDPHLSDRFVLATNRITSGHVIYGTLVVVNDGSAPISLANPWCPEFVVALTNSQYTPQVAWATGCQLGRYIIAPGVPYIIAPGVNRIPIQVITTDLFCGQPSADPACNADGGPYPLPAGTYDAVLVGDGYLALPQPHPVPVTLTMGSH